MENYTKFEGKYCNDCKVFNTNIDDEEKRMIYDILNTKEFEDKKIRIMPDHHAGKGCVIGFTSQITNAINPNMIGVDIGCAITTCITDAKINKNEYPLIEHRIKKEIPFGVNINDSKQFEDKEFLKFLRSEYSKAISSCGDMVNDIYIDSDYIDNMLKRIGMNVSTFYHSLMSVGGGNHFIEFGDYNGCYTFTVHCGSRNFGVKVANYWNNAAKRNTVDKKLYKNEIATLKKTISNKKELPQKINELIEKLKEKNCSEGFIDGENLRGYISDMVIAQAYAKFNHKLICNKLFDILRKVKKEKANVVETIQSIHNYIDICGDCIVRKGAIRSYEGEKMIIPFNMRDGIAICVGKSNSDWNNSAPHGAGRKLSRLKAKETLSMDDFNNEMKYVYSTSIDKSTLDESPMAYKDMNEIIDCIKDTCDIIALIKPIINVKDVDNKSE